MICALLRPYDLARLPWHSAAHVHLVSEAMRRAFAARNAYLGDPDRGADPLTLLLSDEWIARQRETIAERATPSSEISSGFGDDGSEGQHTTHLSIVDGRGNAAALTTTLNLGFGSAVTVEGAGFLLNNEMDDFAAKPGEANAFGLVQGEANAIAPGKRMLSSMTPTIVTAPEGRVVLVLGAAGGPTIITTVFQIVSNVLDFGFDVERAVRAPRFHHQHLPDRILYEDGLGDSEVRALEARGHSMKRAATIADAPSIGWTPGGWKDVPEPRRSRAM
jgi:gamma-glutamyltranspeptidase / glutathione hydrolase